MLVPNKNTIGYKKHVVYFFVFGFLEGVTIIDCLLNMNIYVSNIVESYKGTTVGKLRNSGTLYVLPNIVQC